MRTYIQTCVHCMYVCPFVLALARAQIHATAGVSIQQALHKAMTKRDLSYHTCVVYSATPPLQRIEWSTDTSQLAGQDVRRETHMHTPTQNARTQTQTLHTVHTYTHRQTLHIHSNIYTEMYQHKFKCTRELFKSFSSPLPPFVQIRVEYDSAFQKSSTIRHNFVSSKESLHIYLSHTKSHIWDSPSVVAVAYRWNLFG